MLKLTITFLAGALAFACTPALALELPDSGSKNFSPSGDTPSYFANETAPVSARIADTTERDWSAVDDAAPAGPTVERSRSAHTSAGRHGRYAVAQRSGRHVAGRSSGKAHLVRAASVRNTAASTAKTTSAKHGKPGAGHASTAMLHHTGA
ncbi:MAG TPA: hypothetical protein VKF83_09935 [Stellaceae bacterium]|nr:hypothetical protein [Stellaceae bacterium]